MAVYNLPPVGREALIDPSGSGSWVKLDSLDALARSLRLDQNQIRPDELKSIPDAWAQAQLTTDAFLDPDHDAHEQTVRYWRGLLALFALQPTYQNEYDLQVSTINLAERGSKSRLRAVLNALKPTNAATTGLGWDRMGIVQYVSRSQGAGTPRPAIALLSPVTLVAPGRMIDQFSDVGVPWLADGVTDPLEVSGLPPEAWTILGEFVGQLLEAVRRLDIQGSDANIRDNLSRQLLRFSEDCRAREGASLPLRPERLPYTWPDPFFELLGRTQTVDEAIIQEGNSDCRIELRRGRSAALFQGAILVDPTLAETIGRPPQEVRVWGRHTLRDAASPNTLKRIKADAAERGFLVIEPADFFTDQLVRFERGAEIPGNPPGFNNELLPLSPLSLLLFDGADDWGNSVSLTPSGDSYEVALTVRLASADAATTRAHRIRRTFSPADLVTMAAPDDLAVWPNFESSDWPWTFLRFQYDPKNELQTRFALSADFIAADVGGAEERRRVERLVEWTSSQKLLPEQRLFQGGVSRFEDRDGRLLLERFRFVDQAKLVGEQHRLPHGAEAIFFARYDSKSASSAPAGCVVIRRDQPPHAQDSASVAIDFGTTNTVAYYRREDQPSQRIAFADRVLFPIVHRGAEAALAGVYADFFPLDRHDTPLPTVAKKRDFGRGQLNADVRDQLNQGSNLFGLSHLIFLMPHGGESDDPTYLIKLINEGYLEFDIKWGARPEDRRLVQTYLRQLMVMVAAELRTVGVATENIRWHFSFPQAFTHQQKSAFQSAIQQTWAQLGQDSTSLGREGDYVAFRTEGEAAIRYFTADPIQAEKGVSRLVVMFDIGGGTTDMAVWREQQLVWRGSVRLAGSDFFRRFLVNNMEVLEKIDPTAVRRFEQSQADAGSQTLQADPEYRAKQLVELLVAKPRFSEGVAQQYPIHSGEPAWAALRHCGTAALAGLSHYLGLVLHTLVESGALEPKDLDEITVALGGRGSTLFKHFGDERDRRDLINILSLLASAAGRDPAGVHISPRFSKSPKEEVARGLLVADNAGAPQTGPDPARAEPAGLEVSYKVNGDIRRLEARDDVRPLLNASGVEEIDLAAFSDFLNRLRSATGLKIDISGSAGRIIRQRAVSTLSPTLSLLTDEERSSRDTQAVEPPFITALRYLIEIMSDPVDKRDTALSCREQV